MTSSTEGGSLDEETAAVRPFDKQPAPLFARHQSGLAPGVPRASGRGRVVYVAGTYDTKGEELRYLRQVIAAAGVPVRSVDLSTSGRPSSADVPPHAVAAYRPAGGAAFLDAGADRGACIRAMSEAFAAWAVRQRDLGAVISAGGSGGTALVTPAMRALPIGVPKLVISTVASGDVSEYVGASDIMMMYSVTDVQGLNRISRQVLANGAKAIAGATGSSDDPSQPGSAPQPDDKPALGLTMFGVTTPAVRQLTSLLEADYECLVFHATGTGGRSLEKLADSGLLAAAIDLTTTEVCDLMMGGVFAATEDRFGAFIRTGLPYVGSVGALDMVNFGTPDSVPAHYTGRRFVEHNPQVTLMRTTPQENTRMGEWIAGRLNEMRGPVRFLLPQGGVSTLDAPGQPFHDPVADAALFEAVERTFVAAPNRQLRRLPSHINDAAFAEAAAAALDEIRPRADSASPPLRAGAS